MHLLKLWDGDRIFLKLIDNPAYTFFSLKLCYRGDKLVSAILNGKEDALNGHF